MSRHRNVRNYAYEDEMSDDVYGHSVEDHDMCISPSTARQFLYHRGTNDQQPNLFDNYMGGRFGSVEEEQEEDQSEEEDHLASSQDYRRPQLDPISEAKLSSCLDQLQSVLGDDCHEPTAVDAILKSNFDAEKALDYLFSKENKKDSSQKKTTKKQDSNLYCKLLEKNETTKPISRSQNYKSETINDMKLSALGQTGTEVTGKSTANNNTDTKSLLSMPLSSILTDSKDKYRGVVPMSDMSQGQLLFEPLGNLMQGNQTEKSSLMGATETFNGLSQNSLLSMPLKILAEEQDTKSTSLKESSLSKLASECKTSSPLLCHPTLSSLSKMNQSSNKSEDMDMLTLSSLSSLARQHDDSMKAKPVPLSGVSLQELGNKMPSSLTNHSKTSLHDVMIEDSSVSSLGNKSSSDRTSHHSTGQNSQGSKEEMLFETSLSSLANLSLDGLFGNKNGSTFAVNPKTEEDSKIISPSNNLQPQNEQHFNQKQLGVCPASTTILKMDLSSLLEPKINDENPLNSGMPIDTASSRSYPDSDIKLAKQKIQDSREDKLSKVISTSMKKKKKSNKISQNLMLVMHPTRFALTLCYTNKRKHSFPKHLRSKRLCTSGIPGYYGNRDIKPFDFLSPSPDDVIKMKQRQRFGVQKSPKKANP